MLALLIVLLVNRRKTQEEIDLKVVNNVHDLMYYEEAEVVSEGEGEDEGSIASTVHACINSLFT